MMQTQVPTLDQAKVIVGIPAFNQEPSISATVVTLKGVADEILVCDDGSTDLTAEIARALGCKTISHPRQLGLKDSILSLFLAASGAGADVFVTVSADSKYDASSISKLADAVLNGECDVAIGLRSNGEAKESRIEEGLLSSFGEPLKDPRSPIRAFNREALSKLMPAMKQDTDLLLYASRVGLKIREYPLSSSPKDFDIPVSVPRKSKGSGKKQNLGPFSFLSRLPFLGDGLSILSDSSKRLLDLTLRRPLLFYGGAAVVALLAAIVKSYLTLEAFQRGLGLADFDVIVSAALFLAWIMLTATSVVLYTLSRKIE